jgi:nucleotide-binding universal stress UspA family protein
MRYIIATDGSDSSLKAARFLARQSCPGPGDEVFVLYVFPLPGDPACYDGIVELPRDAADARIRRIAEPVLEGSVAALGEIGAAVETVILVGNPAREIVEFAMNLRVDLIVVGTHGHAPETELYLGSVSSAVAHRAPCSVLIVR